MMGTIAFLLLFTDWPQFLGPARDGTYDGGTYDGPPVGGEPELAWQIDVGAGFAGAVVVGERVILFHPRGGREIVESLDRQTGATGWRYEYETTYRDDFGFDEGPRSVPVVAQGIVYTFGAQGVVSAVDLERIDLVEARDELTLTRLVVRGFGSIDIEHVGRAWAPLHSG